MVEGNPTETATPPVAAERRRGPWTRALVTGGSAGIGEAFARALAGDGAALILVGRRPEPLARLADEIRARPGVQVEVLPADLTDAADLARVETRLEAEQRPVDLLVNNAGGETEHGRFLERDRGLLAAEVALNVLALVRLTHAAIGGMSSRGRGHVINVSAGNALLPTPGSCSYSASKAFVNSFTEGLAYELRDSGVSLTAVCPGFTRTGAQDRLGLDREAFPDFVWREADEVARIALRAARRGKVVSWLGFSGAVAAFAARHLPHRLLTPQVARATARFGND
jgi:short-subunit dehydrogenase